MADQAQNQSNPLLFALKTPSGEYSRIYATKEELEKVIQQHGAKGTIGIVQFVPLCEAQITVNVYIPWEEAIESLKSRYQFNGAGEAKPEASESAVRSGIREGDDVVPGAQPRRRGRPPLVNGRAST